jgi:hypothetical protein
MGRIVPQGCPTGLQRVRYDGVQATKPCAQRKRMRHDAVAKVQGRGKGAITRIALWLYRQRAQQSPGRGPVIGPPGSNFRLLDPQVFSG